MVGKDSPDQPRNRRNIKVFVADVGKQVIGWSWVHFLGMVLAGSRPQGFGECGWYWVQFMMDVFFGTPLLVCLLKVVQYLVRQKCSQLSPLVNFGNLKKGVEFSKILTFQQYLLFLGLVTVMKLTMVLISFYFVHHPIILGLRAIYDSIRPSDLEWRLAMVMVLIPAVVNPLQFLIVDHFIEGKNNKQKEDSKSLYDSPKKVPLLNDAPAEDMAAADSKVEWPHYVERRIQVLRTKCKTRADLSKDRFSEFCQGKGVFEDATENTEFKQYFGFDQFTDQDFTQIFNLIIGTDFQDGISDDLKQFELGLRVQRKLVEMFNKHLDLGNGGEINEEDFKELCKGDAGRLARNLFNVPDDSDKSINDAWKEMKPSIGWWGNGAVQFPKVCTRFQKSLSEQIQDEVEKRKKRSGVGPNCIGAIMSRAAWKDTEKVLDSMFDRADRKEMIYDGKASWQH